MNITASQTCQLSASSNLLLSPAELHVAGRQKKHGGPTGGLPGGSYTADLQVPTAAQSEYDLVHAMEVF